MRDQATRAAPSAKTDKLGLITGHLGRLVRRGTVPLAGPVPGAQAPAPSNLPALPLESSEPDPRKTGVTPELRARYHDIIEEPFWAIAHKCLPHTCVLVERLYDIFKTIEYICRHDIEGDVVECGVGKGGSVMAAGESLAHFGCTQRKIYVYDTFEGMTPPGAHDFDYYGNHQSTIDASLLYWPGSGHFDEIREKLHLCRYPYDHFVLVKGPVEETLPGIMPDRIAFLRLDTDFYESTRQELVHLYPRVVSGGVVTIDDYGHFLGARKAVDDYFATCPDQLMLHRIDYSARSGVKA